MSPQRRGEPLPAVSLIGHFLGQTRQFGDDFSGGELLVGVAVHQFCDAFTERLLTHHVAGRGLARFRHQQVTQRLDREVGVFGSLEACKHLGGERLDAGARDPRRSVDVGDVADRGGVRHDAA